MSDLVDDLKRITWGGPGAHVESWEEHDAIINRAIAALSLEPVSDAKFDLAALMGQFAADCFDAGKGDAPRDVVALMRLPTAEALRAYVRSLQAAAGAKESWRPDICPITKAPFFMWLEHPELGYIPTYGGPFDSYSLCEPDEDGSFRREHYDHDRGEWIEGGAPTRFHLVTDAELAVASATVADPQLCESDDLILASFGCFTGDCPHVTATACMEAIKPEIVRLYRAAAATQPQAPSQQLTGEGDQS